MDTLINVLRLSLYALVGLWIAGCVYRLLLIAYAVLGGSRSVQAQAQLARVARPMVRIWWAMLGLVILLVLVAALREGFGRK